MANIKSNQDINTVIGDLAGTIAAWSLSSTGALLSEMYELFMEDGIKPEQYYNVHMEMLTFFLLDFERYAQSDGGEEFLDLVYDEIVDKTINLVLDEIDGVRENNREEKVLYALDYYNAAAEEYDSCQVLVEKKPDYEGSHTVLGRLGVRVADALGKPPIPEIIDMVSVVAAEALAESELKKKVIEASTLADE
ncbi:MAG: hypothetical protein PHY25_04350 [Dehalococcoidales bacterium]|jgi:hypothetical protein|nr:hypothetical protein [Dehalococcoidales bacterium]MDD4465890.1 hypothetical protein [Dehalococcoidales bacterium]MDD5402350.1 hypothetical protein [Dehalococcoidales bacterium]